VRADRLVAVLLLLQSRRRVTAGEVAAELEVSERTARRDLEALAMAGLPVYSERGRGGGWRLLGGGRTDLSGLSAPEARALFLVAGPQARASPELKAALRKLVHALPEPFRASAESAASSVVVDPGGWGDLRRPTEPAHLGELQAATAEGEQVRIGYAGRQGAPGTRVVDPLGLVLKGTVWYLLAGTEHGMRTFRVSRVSSVEPTGQRVVRPEGFDLAAAWASVVERVDELRTPARVEVLAPASYVPALRWVFEGQCEVGEELADGRVPLVLRGHRVEAMAVRLAGFGAAVEVLSPPEAREQLARIGAELVGAYARTAPGP
jgi:predicted DNA-binding transcriptional regulator YafY